MAETGGEAEGKPLSSVFDSANLTRFPSVLCWAVKPCLLKPFTCICSECDLLSYKSRSWPYYGSPFQLCRSVSIQVDLVYSAALIFLGSADESRAVYIIGKQRQLCSLSKVLFSDESMILPIIKCQILLSLCEKIFWFHWSRAACNKSFNRRVGSKRVSQREAAIYEYRELLDCVIVASWVWIFVIYAHILSLGTMKKKHLPDNVTW